MVSPVNEQVKVNRMLRGEEQKLIEIDEDDEEEGSIRDYQNDSIQELTDGDHDNQNELGEEIDEEEEEKDIDDEAFIIRGTAI